MEDVQGANDQPSQAAIDDIPPRYLELCIEGAQKYSPDIPWHVVCGVSWRETNHGRLNAPGVTSGVNSYGCCAGPVQFSLVLPGGSIGPGVLRANQTNSSTWGSFGVDGNDDGVKDVYDPADAILAAARYLEYGSKASDGDPCPSVQIASYEPKVKRGLFVYNHACWYVEQVLEKAKTYAAAPPVGSPLSGGTLTVPGLGQPNSMGYAAMPESKDGSYRLYSCPAHRYGKPELISTLYTVAQAWKAAHSNGWLWIGDLNAAGHKSHRWGVAVDFSATTNGRDWVADYTKGNYNRQATVQLGEMLLDTGMVKNIWYDDLVVIGTWLRYAQDRKIKPPTIQPIVDHDDHIHLDVDVEHGPENTPGC